MHFVIHIKVNYKCFSIKKFNFEHFILEFNYIEFKIKSKSNALIVKKLNKNLRGIHLLPRTQRTHGSTYSPYG
jgi:hypothetical protein